MFHERRSQLANARVLAIALMRASAGSAGWIAGVRIRSLFDKITSDLALFGSGSRSAFGLYGSLGFPGTHSSTTWQFRCLGLWLPIEPIRPSFGSQRRFDVLHGFGLVLGGILWPSLSGERFIDWFGVKIMTIAG